MKDHRQEDPLQTYHTRSFPILLLTIFLLVAAFFVWSTTFKLDEVVRANGEVVASSHVQSIQAIDGGVLLSLAVSEGDVVEKGSVLARLDPNRFDASAKEVESKLAALRIREHRLESELASKPLIYSDKWKGYPDLIQAERGLYKQRLDSLNKDMAGLRKEKDLASQEFDMIEPLVKKGDVAASDLIKSRRSLAAIESKLAARHDKYFGEAQKELAATRDEIGQRAQSLRQRESAVSSAVIRAPVRGVIKRIAVTTVGGVLSPGDEIMQMISLDDKLLLEVKVRPADIARLHKGLPATLRLDPYDFTIFGGIKASVDYVSADTLKENTARGQEVFYRVRIAPPQGQVLTTVGKKVALIPGMTGSVDIKTGERSLMTYLLKPLRKTLSESFGER